MGVGEVLKKRKIEIHRSVSVEEQKHQGGGGGEVLDVEST